MPVILSEASMSPWLDQRNTDLEQLLGLCVPYPAADMEVHKVSPLVDNEENDTIEVTDPIL
jgi:putative SOS response-associated peptidase YedK